MFETILVAIDGSDHSEKATHLASDIAKTYEASLVLLYVCPEGPLPNSLRRLAAVEFAAPPQPAPVRPSLSDAAARVVSSTAENEAFVRSAEIHEKLGHQVLEYARTIAEEKGIASIKTVLDKGKAADRILEQIEEQGAHLVVMGTRGLGAVKELLLGSVSHKVTQLAPCTCITVR